MSQFHIDCPQHLMKSFIWEVSVFQTLPFSIWWEATAVTGGWAVSR